MKLASAALCALLSAGCAAATTSGAEEQIQSAVTSGGQLREAGIELFLRSAEARGYRMARATVALSDIPRATLPPMLGLRDAESPSPDAPSLDVRGLAFLEGRERSWSCPSHGAARHALCVACTNPERPRAVRAEGPLRGSAVHHELTYELIDGVRHPGVSAAIIEERRTRVVARELLPGFLYAFRFFDEEEPGIELVSFVLPPAIDIQVLHSRPMDSSGDVRGAFSRATLPIRPGASETVRALITRSAAADWIRQISPGASRPLEDDLILGVELSQAGDEPEPQIVAYVSRFRAADVE